MKKLLYLLAVVSVVLMGNARAWALDPCSTVVDTSKEAHADAFVSGLSGTFQVYARLNGKTATAPVALSHNTITYDGCRILGSGTATNASDVALGSFDANVQGDVFALVSSTMDIGDGASAPVLTLINEDSACPQPTCFVSFKGETFEVLPKKISTTFDTLRVGIIGSFKEEATVRRVSYFEDANQLYTRKKLEPFDHRYVGGGDSTLTRLVELDDGTLLRSSTPYHAPEDAQHFILPWLMKNLSTFAVVGIGIVLLILYILVIIGVRKIMRKRRWAQTHIASKAVGGYIPADATERYAVHQKAAEKSREIKLFSWVTLFPIVLLVVFFILNTWVVAIFTVDGVSMETTLRNRSKKVLLKYPVTLSALNRHDFIPKRGDVVVFKKQGTNIQNNQPVASEESFIVKRVLALPGEKVELKGTEIIVYNKEHPEGFSPDKGAPWAHVLETIMPRSASITLREGEMFMVGDDREYSTDSREYGPVHIDAIVGRVVYKNDPTKKPYVYKEADFR